MSEPLPDDAAAVEPIEPAALKEQIDSGEAVTILDVRAESEFEEWQIEGENVETENIPYYEFIEGVDDDLLERVPEGNPTVVVCAKGGSSEFVADKLLEHDVEAANLERGMKGWARIYEYRELDVDSNATIAQYQRPSSGCMAYLVVDGDEALVVDPLRAFIDEYVRDARAFGAEIKYAIDTHVHADHVSGVRQLADATGAEIVLPEPAVGRGIEYDTDYATVTDGDSLTVGDIGVDVIHTPGHTSGMTSYLVDDAVLLTGDGLFTESVARPDLEEGDEGAERAAELLYDTLHEKILTLPDDVVVAPAHFSDAATPREDGTYTATLGELSATMGALGMEREKFVEFVLSDMPPRPSNYEDIIATNLGQQNTDDEEAFELELGPNNCAASQDAMTE